MEPLDTARRCELHVHIGGCLHAEDVLRLARHHQHDIDWHPFTSSYTEAFGADPDPVALIDAALSGDPSGVAPEGRRGRPINPEGLRQYAGAAAAMLQCWVEDAQSLRRTFLDF